MPLHVLLEAWRRATLIRFGDLEHDPVDVMWGAMCDRRLIKSALGEEDNPFIEGDPYPWFGPLFAAVTYLLDIQPRIATHRNRVRIFSCYLNRLS